MKSINNLIRVAVILAALATSYIAMAKLPQLHIYRNDDKMFHKIEGSVAAEHRITGGNDQLILSSDGDTLEIPMINIDRIVPGHVDIPTLIINTPEFPDLYQLEEKDTYLNATVQIDGNGVVEDAETVDLKIKGRGNSTWQMPKKPMRLKFSKKTAFAGFKKAKNFVLLANYIDQSLMRNAIAMKIAQLLEVPYANHILPCNVVFNGHDLGCFMLTEKVGINSGSVDIDEEKGMLFELSMDYDEPYKFRSEVYDLPVMVKDPDLDEIVSENPELGTASEIFEKWQADFNRAEALVDEGRGFEAFDLDSFVNFFLLNNICGNNEIGFPKSVYVHKDQLGGEDGVESVYKFGPAWDFDVAFDVCNLDENGDTKHIFKYGNIWMNRLFEKLYVTPGFKERYKERLQFFYHELYPQLLEYFDEYADQINTAAKVNGSLWPDVYYNNWIYVKNTFDHESRAKELRDWLQNRVVHLLDLSEKM